MHSGKSAVASLVWNLKVKKLPFSQATINFQNVLRMLVTLWLKSFSRQVMCVFVFACVCACVI